LNLEDFNKVSSAAVQSIEGLLEAWLPNGVHEGNEYLIGSRAGEAGRSMRIRLTGEKAGCWSDFSGDRGDAGGDLISLYAYINGCAQGKACAAIAQQLGVVLAGDKRIVAPALKPRLALVPNGDAAAADAGGEKPKPKKSKSLWVPVTPVPDDAGPYPSAHMARGRPDQIWEYRDQERRLLGIACRFTTSDGDKDVLPCVYARHVGTGKCKWHWISFQEPRPLYLQGPLRPELPVLVVEGEKCADAAHALLGEVFDVVAWPGGCKVAAKADWSPLRGRNVVLWPDADAKRYNEKQRFAGEIKPAAEQPGMVAMIELADRLAAMDCVARCIDIPPPGEKPDGWDIADLIAGGATKDEVLEWTAKLRAPAQAASGVKTPAQEAHAGDTGDGIPAWVTADLESISTATAAGAQAMSWGQLRSIMLPTSTGGVKACRENVFLALKHDPMLQGIVALDTFAVLQIKRRTPPWKSDLGEWTEGDDFHLGMYVAKKYGLVMASVGEIEKAVAQIASEYSFNPVTDYLDQCAADWDGTPRVALALAAYWGVEPTEYAQLVSTMFFTGLVARAFQPGVKHDYAPVFEGGQGVGKSTALSILGGSWFADTPFRMGEKDGYLSIQGVWIYEIAELEQFNRSEVTAIKAFMSSCVDRYREPYGRRMKNMPRRTLFAATTNEGQYFKDPTGNRRFWPVAVGRIDLDSLARDRDQLFGEAVHMFRQKVRWYPTQQQQLLLINPEQENREIPDLWIGRLYDYCEGLSSDGKPVMYARLDKVTVRELLVKALNIEIGKLGPAKQETMRLSAAMRKLGWRKNRETGGAREYFYERPKADEPEAQTAAKEDEIDLPI
jgi:putative DNA primase/helicase